MSYLEISAPEMKVPSASYVGYPGKHEIQLVEYCLRRVLDCKGHLNEHHYDNKLATCKKNRQYVEQEQSRLRFMYEVARLNLKLTSSFVAAAQSKNRGFDDPNTRQSLIKKLVAEGSLENIDPWIEAMKQGRVSVGYIEASQSQIEEVLNRAFAELANDVTKGEGRKSLEENYARFQSCEENLFSFDLLKVTDEIRQSMPLWVLSGIFSDEFKQRRYVDYLLTLMGLHCYRRDGGRLDLLSSRNCLERYFGAKSSLNEKNYEDARSSALFEGNAAMVKELDAIQAGRRSTYVAAVLQGMLIWRKIDQTVEQLKIETARVSQMLEDNRVPDDDFRAVLKANCVLSQAFANGIRKARKECYNFEAIAREPYMEKALKDFKATLTGEFDSAVEATCS